MRQKQLNNDINFEEVKQLVKAEVLAEMKQEKKEKRKDREEPMEVEQSRKKLKMERIEKKVAGIILMMR